jgi:hypothetical protein
MASASTSQSTKKLYPDGTVFVLRYARKWETLTADNLTDALAARAIKEATLLTEQPSIVAKEPAKRVGIDDAMSVYVSNTVATKKHRTLLAYTLATSDADDMMAYAKHNQLRPLGIVVVNENGEYFDFFNDDAIISPIDREFVERLFRAHAHFWFCEFRGW